MGNPAAVSKIEGLVYSALGRGMFTQRSAIMYDGWIRYGVEGDRPQDLLLVAHRDSSGPALASAIRRGRSDPDGRGTRRLPRRARWAAEAPPRRAGDASRPPPREGEAETYPIKDH